MGESVHVRLSDEQRALLRELAHNMNVSMSQVVVDAVTMVTADGGALYVHWLATQGVKQSALYEEQLVNFRAGTHTLGGKPIVVEE